MIDPAHAATDDILNRIERRVAAEYRRASNEVESKLNEYMRRFQTKDAIKRRKLAAGEISQQEYNQWRIGQIMIGRRWEEMRDSLARDYHNSNEIARSIVHGYMPEVYALNHNYGTFDVERGSLVDTSYTLYTRETVERIIRENPSILPTQIGRSTERELQDYKARTGKDLRWQAGQIQSVTMQAILQGESIQNISRRIARTMGEVNHKSTIRYARTAITSAENAGRLDSYRRAVQLGIQVKKTWLATLDRRTRHAHRQLDGQTRPIDEPYDSPLGEIMYPGDPEAAPANIWNCRCSQIAKISGFERDVTDRNLRHDKHLGDMTYEEWKKEKQSISHPITKQEEIAEAMRWKYIREDYM